MESYLEQQTIGWWKNKLLFLADDEYKCGTLEGIGEGSGLNHTFFAEQTANLLNHNVLIDKVYGIDYTFDENGNKPQTTADLISKLNNGVLCWHYIGHGNCQILGDEYYFDADSDLSALDNGNRLFLFTAASPSVGDFFHAEYDCLSERLLFLENGGAIASVTASQMVGGQANNILFEAFYQNIIN